ncbi:hypothetical protein [Brachybacterium hainanense]|uniref:MFS transporter n=1 Tax=Brachybacterium hainanense TaxID=1541174 RepID=A0ABV6RDY6_9MICO
MPSSALLWGLHSSLLSPALAIILATLYDASTADIGWTLAVYNAGGFVASLAIPAWADRRRSYLQVMLGCGALTIALACVLAAVTSLPLATTALVVLGGPAGLGSTMLFAHLRDAGASTSSIVNIRAIISVAWMGGPPLATGISHLTLVAVGAIAGIVYYLGLAAVTGPILLLALQLLNAVSFAAISRIGLALFQDLIPGAGLSTGLYMNTRRVGSIVSGPIIALGALPLLGQRGIFLACAVLTVAGLGLVHAARKAARNAVPGPATAEDVHAA